MRRPRFSIIIPVYNVADYLDDCLNSVIDQDYVEWEALCVDDGSTDCSAGILDRYASLDRRIKVVHQKNYGVSIARNNGLRLACGDWIGFLDPDDFVSKGWLSEVNSIIDVENPDCVRMSAKIVNEQGEGAAKPESNRYVVLNTEEDIRHWGWDVFTKYGWSWLIFAKRSVAYKALFPEGVRYSEDSLRNLQVLPVLRKVCQSEYAGYYYRNRSLSACKRPFSVDERILFFREYQKLNLKDAYERKRFARHVWSNLVTYWMCHVNGEDIRPLWESFNTLVVVAKISGADLKFFWRIPFIMWTKFRLGWPIKMVAISVRLVAKMKSICVCDKNN